MAIKASIGLLLLGSLGCGDVCIRKVACAEGIEEWINEAPQALIEFQRVRDEIKADTAFVARFDVRGSLFLRDEDTADYAEYNVPLMIAWLRNSRGYIAMDPGDTSVSFRFCEVTGFLAGGSLYSGTRSSQYKSAVELLDSMNLGNGWYAHVTRCLGCDD